MKLGENAKLVTSKEDERQAGPEGGESLFEWSEATAHELSPVYCEVREQLRLCMHQEVCDPGRSIFFHAPGIAKKQNICGVMTGTVSIAGSTAAAAASPTTSLTLPVLGGLPAQADIRLQSLEEKICRLSQSAANQCTILLAINGPARVVLPGARL